MFATGRSPKHAAVAVTTGLWERLEPKEIEGVLAHELSHIANRDVLIMTVASFFAMLAALITRFGLYAGMFGGFGGGGGNRDTIEVKLGTNPGSTDDVDLSVGNFTAIEVLRYLGSVQSNVLIGKAWKIQRPAHAGLLLFRSLSPNKPGHATRTSFRT